MGQKTPKYIQRIIHTDTNSYRTTENIHADIRSQPTPTHTHNHCKLLLGNINKQTKRQCNLNYFKFRGIFFIGNPIDNLFIHRSRGYPLAMFVVIYSYFVRHKYRLQILHFAYSAITRLAPFLTRTKAVTDQQAAIPKHDANFEM